MTENESNRFQEQSPKSKRLIQLLKPHVGQMTSVRNWNEFSKAEGIPHSQTLIQHFGSWNAVKEVFGVEAQGQHRPSVYSAEDVRTILKTHGHALQSASKWNKYANDNGLPNYQLLFTKLDDEEISELTGYRKRTKWTKENLGEVILRHFPDAPPSSLEWQMTASANKGLPAFSTIINKFGSWSAMKRQLYRNASRKK